MTLSEHGLLFIARFEGYRRFGYNAGDGLFTIGYGHVCGPWTRRALYRARYPLGLGPKAALRLLRRDATVAQRAVQQYARHDLKPEQFDALCSFTFNSGAGALAHSTLLQDVNRKAISSVIEADFLRWDHVGGQEWPGLKLRRQEEANLYNGR